MQQHPGLLNRRRFIGIAAMALGAAAHPALAAEAVTWKGVALGASARMLLHHGDPNHARRTIARALAEVRRLEAIFSLYLPGSALSILNRTGVLLAPPGDLLAVLAECRRFHALTGGAFDPTVQPLWKLYAEHFAAGDAAAGPPASSIAAASGRIGLHLVRADADAIVLGRRGMALTLNGIAQGYVTDRVADILEAAGFRHCLISMGEERAIGPRPDGNAWSVGIADPADPSRLAHTVPLAGGAVATSGGYGFRFDPAGRFNHLIDPRSGASAGLYRSVTAVMPEATAADALSTAFSFMEPDAIRAVLSHLGQGSVHLVAADGRPLHLTA